MNEFDCCSFLEEEEICHSTEIEKHLAHYSNRSYDLFESNFYKEGLQETNRIPEDNTGLDSALEKLVNELRP